MKLRLQVWRCVATLLLGWPVAGLVTAMFAKAQELPSPAAALAARPSQAQKAWQEREMELFLHFGINTFAGVEWGSGRASPQLFNPTNLVCRQWVAVARSGGARGAVLTVKHHDGFCL